MVIGDVSPCSWRHSQRDSLLGSLNILSSCLHGPTAGGLSFYMVIYMWETLWSWSDQGDLMCKVGDSKQFWFSSKPCKDWVSVLVRQVWCKGQVMGDMFRWMPVGDNKIGMVTFYWQCNIAASCHQMTIIILGTCNTSDGTGYTVLIDSNDGWWNMPLAPL